MELRVFAVFDSKCAAYMQPFYFPNTGQALRAFQDLANDPTSMIAKHPLDFTLFSLGTYDDVTGEHATAPASHSSLGKAIEFQNKED